jgi:cytochrome c553
LRAFADRTRFGGIMSSIAAGLGDGTMREIAAYYEQLPPREGFSGESSTIMRGLTIATQGVPARDIPACAECHGPSDVPRNPAYPRLAGQHARYLASQLDLLKARRRGGTVNVNLMHVFVDRLTPDLIGDVTTYYATAPK